jgi:hypothetical protein
MLSSLKTLVSGGLAAAAAAAVQSSHRVLADLWPLPVKCTQRAATDHWDAVAVKPARKPQLHIQE